MQIDELALSADARSLVISFCAVFVAVSSAETSSHYSPSPMMLGIELNLGAMLDDAVTA